MGDRTSTNSPRHGVRRNLSVEAESRAHYEHKETTRDKKLNQIDWRLACLSERVLRDTLTPKNEKEIDKLIAYRNTFFPSAEVI